MIVAKIDAEEAPKSLLRVGVGLVGTQKGRVYVE
jgi:hypothetical protein